MSEQPQNGRAYWRSLEERADDPKFREMLEREFPDLAAEWDTGKVDRRRFLTLMGASLSLAGLACTRQPTEYIAPYVNQPESMIPGNPLFYATARTLGGYGTGLLVESHEGRPTKIEGNPEHPASLGGTDAMAQAEILSLYDPDRSQAPLYRGEIRPWSAFVGALPPVLEAQRSLKGSGLHVLTRTVTSPALAAQLRRLQSEFPEASWYQYEPVGGDGRRDGARLAFGRDVATRYDFSKTDVILALDADFLSSGPGHLRYIRDYTERRAPGDGMNRLYAVETTPTLTGAKADKRLPVRPSWVQDLAAAVASRVGVGSVSGDAHGHEAWVQSVADDLAAHRGRSLVLAGEEQAAGVHALAHAINSALGNVGATVIHTEPIEVRPENQDASIRRLVGAMDRGEVEALFVLGGNPVYDSPGDLDFASGLEKVALRVHLSSHYDETSERSDWHLPEAHFLESWGDVRAFDGTVSIQQPLIAPLYGGRTALEVLSSLLDSPGKSAHDLVRDHWKANQPPDTGTFQRFWQIALHDGLIGGTVAPQVDVRLRGDWSASLRRSVEASPLELVVRPDPSVLDGRYANNGWLQELPKPLSKLTWENAALISPATAASLDVSTEFSSTGGEHGQVFVDTIELTAGGRTLTVPIWIAPGAPDDTITVHLGYGRTRGGKLAEGMGFNAFVFRTAASPWHGAVTARKTAQRATLANTQGHWNMEGRDLVRVGTLADFVRDPSLAPHGHHTLPEMSMYPGFEYKGYAWGMSIDLNNCVGCNACVVACQAENNIPVVGKEQVAAGREMHWLRVDRYHSGDPLESESIETVFQPVPCMHCENAPCELVCPVAATVHSAEGLNDMVYNRCVGTRYCANNCPYKVRRFNFFLYQDWTTESVKLARNPDVTVRSRGVMEKCTYCVQRINEAKIGAELDDRKVRDADLQTACQQACPAHAIHFGDINNPDSKVAKLKSGERDYGLLPEVNARPRTTYMGTVRNSGEAAHSGGGHDEDSHG